VAELRERINRYAASAIDLEPMERRLKVDAEIRLSDVDDVVFRQIQRLSPFGNENPTPVFVAHQLTLIAEPRILKGKHLKFRVEQDGRAIDALAWNMADRLPSIRKSGGILSLAFELSQNPQPRFKVLQLVVRDIRVD
jgi:single-stranded-DNA-specific exonuclease